MGVTVITGASSGIGRSLARRLARHDAIALLARRPDALQTVADEITRARGHALAVPCDVTDRAALATAIETIEHQLGPISRLVANAGGGEPTFVDDYDSQGVAAVIERNLLGVSNSVGAVLPGMLARGHGHLVATGSLAGRRGLPSAAAYSAAKAGVAAFMESLRVDLRGRGVAVTLLEPGFVQTQARPAAKSRRKPFRLDLDTATRGMEKAILAKRARWVAPRRLAVAVVLLGLLPSYVYDRLLAGRGRKR